MCTNTLSLIQEHKKLSTNQAPTGVQSRVRSLEQLEPFVLPSFMRNKGSSFIWAAAAHQQREGLRADSVRVLVWQQWLCSHLEPAKSCLSPDFRLQALPLAAKQRVLCRDVCKGPSAVPRASLIHPSLWLLGAVGQILHGKC